MVGGCEKTHHIGSKSSPSQTSNSQIKTGVAPAVYEPQARAETDKVVEMNGINQNMNGRME